MTKSRETCIHCIEADCICGKSGYHSLFCIKDAFGDCTCIKPLPEEVISKLKQCTEQPDED